MQFSHETIADFIRIYADDLGETLSEAKATLIATDFLRAYSFIVAPTPDAPTEEAPRQVDEANQAGNI